VNLREAFEQGRRFVLRELWSLELTRMSRWRKLGFRSLRTVSLAVHGFMVDKCATRAAALTLVFLFSLAPTLAVGFSVAKGFEAQQRIRENLPHWLGLIMGDNEFANSVHTVLAKVLDYVDQTSVSALGTLGMAILLYTAYQLLSSIEGTMNAIWGIRRQRPLVRKFVDYAAVVFVLPIMLIITAAVTASLRIEALVDWLRSYDALALNAVARVLSYRHVAKVLGTFTAFTFATVGFWFLYFFFPNTKVRFTSALIGAATASVLVQILQWVFLEMQVGVSRLGAVYGTFAAVPIFLLWLHFFWIVVLFGAELSYAHANQRDLEYGGISFAASPAYEEQLAVGAMALVGRAFARGEQSPTCEALARALGAPVRVMRDVLQKLIKGRLLVELQGDVPRLHPALPVERITVGRIVEAVRESGDRSEETAKVLERLGVRELLARRSQAAAEIDAVSLREIIAPDHPPAPPGVREA